MLPKKLLLVVLAGLMFSTDLAIGQTPDIKALKYHKVLLKRPEPGYLYDRFYNTWLDDSTVDQLKTFLTDRVEQEPATAERLLLAFFHVKQGNDVSALEEFRKALLIDPASAATWYHKALVEARTLDFDTAIADLRKAREQSPSEKLSVQIAKQLGKLLVRNQKTEAALKVWQELLAAHSGDEELQEDIIELHIDEGLYPQAAKLSLTLVKQTKDPYLAVTRRLRLGDIHHRSGDRAKALEIYTLALEQVGYDTWLEREVLAQIEQIFRREDDLTGLKKQYTTLLEQHSKRIAIHRRHAQLLAELGDAEEAMAAYQKILELTPGDRTNREAFITMLTKLDRHEPAVKELEALCAQHPKDAELRFWLANLRQRASQKDRVAAEVDRYLELSDGSEYAYLRAARLLERFKLTDDARRIYEKMAKAHAESPAAREAYAAFLYSQEKKDKAIAIWRTLAEGADLSQTLHVARGLVSRHENETAFELLTARREDFDDQQLFYSQLVTTALALKKYEEAIPWALRRVELAQSVTELERAIGQAALVFDRAEQLEEMVQKLAAQSPRSVLLTCLLAELWEQSGDSEQADAVLTDIAQQGQLFAVSQQIRLFTGRRDWQAAADATRRILELPGGKKSLHVRRLVELYTRDYQFPEALKWIESWRQLSPGSTSPWLSEARLLRLQGKDTDAVNVLRKASGQFEDDEDLRVKLAQTYVELGKPGDAERIYWQLYGQTTDLSGKLQWVQQLAKLSQQQGKTVQLVENFEERRRNNRRSIVPLLALSEIHRVADNYEGRRQALTAAAKIKPDDLQLLLQIARIEESEGKWEASLATLERAVPLDKTNKTRERIAGLHFRYGEADDGFAILYELIQGEQPDPRSLESFADAMCAMQEWERAVDFLQKHIVEFPADYRLHYLLGVAFEEADQPVAAAEVFLTLLNDQEELSSKTKKTQSSHASMSSYMDMLKQLAPPNATDWLKLMQSKYTVYSYRQQQNRAITVSMRAGAGGTRSSINLPSRVDDVRSYALAHLVTLREVMDDEQVDDLAERMTGRGIPDASALLKLGTDHNTFGASVTEILAEQPEHETALAVMVLQQMGRQQGDTSEQCAKACELFRQSYPQLALMAAAQAARQDAEYLPLLEQGIQSAQEIKKPSPMLLIALVMQLGGQPGMQQQDSALNEETRKKLTKLIIDWYPHMLQSPQYSTWAFMYVTQALRNGGDPSTYIHFLEDEVARWHAGKRSRNNPQMAAMLGRRGTTTLLLEPLRFPPRLLVDFPANVLALLSDLDNSNPYSHMMRQQSANAWEMETMKPLLKDVKDPILRVLLTHQANSDELEGENELIEQTLAELVEAESPRADAFLLAAGWATQQEKFGRAAELLEKVRYLPMKRDLRRRVDAALVAMAIDKPTTKEQAGQPAVKKLNEIGRMAALRLRRGKLDGNQRSELIAAMEDLGLKKEAKKLERVAAATPATSRPTATGYGRYLGGRTKVQKDRIAKLIEQGKREMAVKLLAKEVTGQAQQFSANMHNYGWRHRQFRQTRERVQSLGMENEVLDALDPGESTNPRRLNDFALVSELFGKTDLARGALEKLLNRTPRDDNTRMRLIMLLHEEDPGAVDEHLAKLADTSSQMMGQVLSGSLNDHEMSLDKRVAIMRVGFRYLQILKERKKAQLGWVEGLVYTLAHQMHARRGTHLPSLYALKESNRKVPTSHTDLQKRREALHNDFCRAMLESPQTARAGFRHLLAAAEAKEEVGEEFTTLAENTLRGEATAKANSFGGMVRHLHSSNQNEVRLRSPEEFLVRQAWLADDWTTIDENLLPELEKAARKQTHQSLQRQVQLYRSEEEKFIDVAKSAIRKAGRSRFPGMPNNGAVSTVIDAWGDRKLAVDIGPLVLDHIKQEISSPNHYQPPGYLIRYLKFLSKQDSPAAVSAMLDEVATLYVGPRDKRIAFIKKNFQQNNIQWNAPSGRIYVFRQLMQQLISQEALMLPTLRHLGQYGDVAPVENLEHYARSGFNKLKQQGPEELLKAMAEASWLGELEQFEPLSLTGVAMDSPLVTLITEILKEEKYLKKFSKLLEERHSQEATFGTGLLLAALDRKDEPLGLLEYLGSRMTAIEQLPEKRQVLLSTVFKRLVMNEAIERDDLGEAALAARDWLEGGQAKQVQKQLDELLASKRFEDLGIQYYNVDDYLSKRIPKLVTEDLQVARETFLKVCDLADDARRRGKWHQNYGNGRTLRGNILGNIFNRGHQSHDLETLVFFIEVLQNDKGIPIEVSRSVQSVITRCLRHNYDRYTREALKGEDRKSVALHRLYKELESLVGERPASLLIPGYTSLLRNGMNDSNWARIAKWLEKEASDSQSAYARDWQAALAMTQSRTLRQKSQPDPDAPFVRAERADHHAHLEAILNDDDLPLPWRMRVAEATMFGDSTAIPAKTAVICLGVYNQSLSASVPLPSNQQTALLNLCLTLVKEPAAEEAIDQWREKWADRYLRSVARQNNRTADNPHSLSDTSTLSHALKVFLRTDGDDDEDSDRISKFLHRHEQSLGSDRAALGLLIQSGKHELAARLFRAQWAKVDVHRTDKKLLSFDDRLRDNLSSTLEELQQDDEKYLAEAIVTSLPDRLPMDKQAEDRDARLVRLANRYEQIKFTKDTYRNRVLEIFSTSDEAAKVTAVAIADRFEKLDLLAAAQNNNQERLMQLMHIVSQHCRNRFRADDPQPWVDTVGKFTRHWTDNSHELGRALKPLVESALDSIEHDGGSWDADQAAAVATGLRSILTDREHFYLNYYQKYNMLLLLTHARSEPSKQLLHWYNGLGKNTQNQMKNSGVAKEFWEYAHAMIPESNEENLQERVDLVRNILHLASDLSVLTYDDQSFYIKRTDRKNLFNSVVEHKLLSAEEISAVADQFVEGVKHGYPFAGALAGWYNGQKDYESAAKYWRIAQETTTSKQQKAYAQFYVAEALHKAGKNKLASEELAGIDEKVFPSNYRNRYNKLKKTLAENR